MLELTVAESSCDVLGDTIPFWDMHTGMNQSLTSLRLSEKHKHKCMQTAKFKKALLKFLQLKMADIYIYYENIILGIKYFDTEGKTFLKFHAISTPAQFNFCRCLLLIWLALLAIP